ncbi:hypothetical protein LZ554_002997 [Drepanopeziza brunnea f. sp. 'monogermtubi']|nr:hypothetical protein LZ554_002997 [Drepanopeziza brunnea f. sp. 'monogermtubi']
MSTSSTFSTRLAASRKTPPAECNHNPFEPVSDDDDNDDEWWDEDDTSGLTPPKAKEPSSRIRITEWPKPPTGLGMTFKTENRRHSRKPPGGRYSVQKLSRDKSKGRQKKQNAKAGIKVVTNFSRHQSEEPPVQLQPSRTAPQMGGCFVDLAALQALNGGSSQSSGFWKTKKNNVLTRAPNIAPSLSAVPSSTSDLASPVIPTTISGRQRSDTLDSSPSRGNDELSPNDRPIVIGLSITTEDAAGHTLSPQTAASETSRIVRNYEIRTPVSRAPDTPTIIITPAKEASLWSPTEQGVVRPTSSLYSAHDRYTANDAPPVPQMPASILEDERQRVAAQRSYFSPDSVDVATWGDEDETRKSRVVSSCTVFEEDESPVIAKSARAVSVDTRSNCERHASISTVATRRRSRGWWNYITTPFLTRSNTFAHRDTDTKAPPDLPSLAIAATKAQDHERNGKMWEKQFSPLTPETSTSDNSDQWWVTDPKHGNQAGQSPILRETRHKPQTSSGTLHMVLSGTAGFGTAIVSSIASEVGQLSRGNTSASAQSNSSFHSTTDRVVPVLSGAPARPLRGNNPFVQPCLSDLNERYSTVQAVNIGIEAIRAEQSRNGQHIQSPSAGPPPPYSPSPVRVKYKAVFPPGHALGIQSPTSPGPMSPGLQQAMSSTGAIPMSEVPLTPVGRRPINLNSVYPELPTRHTDVPVTGEHYGPPPQMPTKAEARRRRHEKEDAAARRVGGWWRGRGCIPDRGCYGRTGPEGRKRRRWYIGLTVGFVVMIIIVVSLASTLHRESNTIVEPSQWLNLTGFPPIFLGMSTVAAPVNIRTNTGCIFPATQWSCDVPKELQASIAPNPSNQPNFFLHVQWDNSSSTNATFTNVTGNPNLVDRRALSGPVFARQIVRSLLLKSRQIVAFAPNPAPPSFAEELFLGNSTDGIISDNKAGEPTPFYISFLPSPNSALQKRSLSLPPLSARQASSPSDLFPNLSSIIPLPSLNADKTAAPANLLPFPTQQPIRLYDRGLPTEHYGFYTYFDRSIFLKSLDLLNSSNLDNGEVPADRNGGSTEAEAKFRCTWSQTRFLVQMWTRMNGTAQLLNSTTSQPPSHPSPSDTESAATSLTQPGSFPYPITITTDRHGGDPAKKMVYCYGLDDRANVILDSGKLNGENRAFGGQAFNPAPSLFGDDESLPGLGGFDGGTGGCSCAWSNFMSLRSG